MLTPYGEPTCAHRVAVMRIERRPQRGTRRAIWRQTAATSWRLREEVDSGVPASSGDRDVVAAADRPAFDDVGVDADVRLIVLRCGTQDAGIFG